MISAPTSNQPSTPLHATVSPILSTEAPQADLLLDALTYARGGAWSLFERLASHVGDEPWFAIETARTLSSLGHIDLRLDPATGRPTHWATSLTTFCMTAQTNAVLAGARSTSLLERLQADVDAAGGEVDIIENPGAPATIQVRGFDDDDLQDLAASLSKALGIEILVNPGGPTSIAANLPALKQVASALPPLSWPMVPIERFEIDRNKWEAVPALGAAGAYKFMMRPLRYGFLAGDGSPIASADNRLVKWLAARQSGCSLLAYNPVTEELPDTAWRPTTRSLRARCGPLHRAATRTADGRDRRLRGRPTLSRRLALPPAPEGGGLMAAQPISVYNAIKDAYLRYYETAFRLRDEPLRNERRALLEQPGVIFTDPLIEPVLPYDSSDSLADVCADLGLPPTICPLLADMLFDQDGDFRLRTHQAEALRISLGEDSKRNIVVTSGTGSGKTESFLLPIFARLLHETRKWPVDPPLHRWWDSGAQGKWEPARRDFKRPAATRAMVLYPTNALVEDQISRLRRGLIRASARGLPQLFFGRYTGATLGSGDRPARLSADAVKAAALELRRMETDRDLMETTDIDLISQFADPRRGELLARWDMVATPPDILVTNYSMLNVMLMREREDELFAKTASWLASSEEHAFTLVIDELHSYRGTAGTEVALVIRNLLRRIGIDPASPQLRCIGTSASLDSSEGLEYLEQFFGVDRSTFRITSGQPRLIKSPSKLSRAHFEQIAAAEGDEREQSLMSALAECRLRSRCRCRMHSRR